MRLLLAVLGVLLISQAAGAFELGGLLGIRDDYLQTDQAGTNVNAAFGGFQAGGLAFIDIIPMLQLRTGVIYTSRQMTGTIQYFGSVNFTSTEGIINFPVNVQVNFPIKIYAFGGAMYSSEQTLSCNSGNSGLPCPISQSDDIPLDIGAGYNIVDLAVFKLGLELEYDIGTRNLAPSYTGAGSYFRGFSVNALARVGL